MVHWESGAGDWESNNTLAFPSMIMFEWRRGGDRQNQQDHRLGHAKQPLKSVVLNASWMLESLSKLTVPCSTLHTPMLLFKFPRWF